MRETEKCLECNGDLTTVTDDDFDDDMNEIEFCGGYVEVQVDGEFVKGKGRNGDGEGEKGDIDGDI